jgi:hypothetical protein
MNLISDEDFFRLLPHAITWVSEQEQLILETGISLSTDEMEIAKQAKIANIQSIRLLQVEKIPRPQDKELLQAIQTLKVISESTNGLTMGNGIFIRTDFWRQQCLIAHELFHVRQYELSGGIGEFLKEYLLQCRNFSYSKAPMEQDAVNFASNFK